MTEEGLPAYKNNLIKHVADDTSMVGNNPDAITDDKVDFSGS